MLSLSNSIGSATTNSLASRLSLVFSSAPLNFYLKQNKEMGKLGIVPGLFTINEPVVFGYPLIMNPILAIPFILTPIVQTLVAYFAMAIGLVPPLTGVQVPWCMPIIIKPLLAGGWQAAVLQVVCIAIGCLVWYPFFKVSDNQRYKEEISAKGHEEA